MNSGSLENESDEVLALKFELENAREAIVDILNSFSSDQKISLATLRQKMKSSLSDFANVCLTQIGILNSTQNPLSPPKLPQFPKLPPIINEKRNLIPVPLMYYPTQYKNPPELTNNNQFKTNLFETRYRKQNLFDDLKYIEESEDSSSENSGDKDSSSEVIQIVKRKYEEKTAIVVENDIKGDLKATTEFLDEYRKQTLVGGTNENCPEKFTQKQLENLGSTPYKKTENDILKECEICFEEYLENQKVSFLTCHHKFHTVCIKNWLLCKNECPICGLKACLEYNS